MSGNVLWQAGPFSVSRFGLCLAAGGLCWLFSALWLGKARYGKRLGVDQLAFTALCMAVWGVICARLTYCAVHFDWYLPETGEPLAALRLWEGGVSLSGALAGALLGLCMGAKCCRARTGWLANSFAPGWGLFAAWTAMGLLTLGEGWGKIAEAEWVSGSFLGVKDRYGDWRYAVYRLDALVGLAVFFAGAIRMLFGRRPAGWSVLAYTLGLWAMGRMITASMREGEVLRVEYIRIEQVAALAALLVIALCRLGADLRAGAAKSRCWTLLVLAAGAAIAVAMEFAVDREGSLEEKYALMLAGAILCFFGALAPGAANRARRLAKR